MCTHDDPTQTTLSVNLQRSLSIPLTLFLLLLQFDIGNLNHGSPASAKQRLAAVKQRLQDITERLMNPQHIMLRDKVAFSLGSCQLW